MQIILFINLQGLCMYTCARIHLHTHRQSDNKVKVKNNYNQHETILISASGMNNKSIFINTKEPNFVKLR